MRNADITSGKKEILHVLCIKAAQGHLKGPQMIGVGISKILVKNSIPGMVIAKTTVGNAIVKFSLFVDIRLGINIVADEAAVFTSSWHCGNPVQVIRSKFLS